MELLETHFSDRTFTYTQLQRHGEVAIYQQTHRHSGITRYEVVKIRRAPAKIWPDGHITPEREVYPGSGQWGTLGHTFFSLDAARHVAAMLVPQSTTPQEVQL